MASSVPVNKLSWTELADYYHPPTPNPLTPGRCIFFRFLVVMDSLGWQSVVQGSWGYWIIKLDGGSNSFWCWPLAAGYSKSPVITFFILSWYCASSVSGSVCLPTSNQVTWPRILIICVVQPLPKWPIKTLPITYPTYCKARQTLTSCKVTKF